MSSGSPTSFPMARVMMRDRLQSVVLEHAPIAVTEVIPSTGYDPAPLSGSMHNPPLPIPDAELPEIAIGLLSYNRAAEVIESLDIFLGIDYPMEKVRLIVIDNASTDGTKERVEERYGERVHVMRLPQNKGAIARNCVMMTRPEPYIFVFDEDCAPESPATIRRTIEYMEANPYFGALCFRSINSFTGLTEWGDFQMVSRRRLDNGGYEGLFVIGNGMCFRRDAIQGTAGYDETIFWGGEEYDLGLEMLSRDVPIVYVPELMLLHRHAPREVTPPQAIEIYTRNYIWASIKFFPMPLAIVVAFIHTFRRFATALLKRRPGGVEAVLRGVRKALAGIRDVHARRTPIPISKFAQHNRWFFQMFYAMRSSRVVEVYKQREDGER